MISLRSLSLVGAATIVVALFLGGCYDEGAGFSNRGAYRNQRQCMRVDQYGHEIWFSVPASRRCP